MVRLAIASKGKGKGKSKRVCARGFTCSRMVPTQPIAIAGAQCLRGHGLRGVFQKPQETGPAKGTCEQPSGGMGNAFPPVVAPFLPRTRPLMKM